MTLDEAIRKVPVFPKPEVLFYNITSIFTIWWRIDSLWIPCLNSIKINSIHEKDIALGKRWLIIDDLVATGGTLAKHG